MFCCRYPIKIVFVFKRDITLASVGELLSRPGRGRSGVRVAFRVVDGGRDGKGDEDGNNDFSVFGGSAARM